MAAKSKARPSKKVLDQIVSGRGIILVTLGGQARYWDAYRVAADQTPEGTKAWTVRLRTPWPDETLATFDVMQTRDGYISCLAEGWQDNLGA
jgi:hypothetical protein